jgi:3'(2'), 5'-bisphosphate nucleotidase
MSGIKDDAAMLDLFERLALDAGRVIMEFYERGAKVDLKGDRTPVTEADRAAEQIILRGLRKALPGIACVAEEEIACGAVVETTGASFILVDPLDGTREFIDRKGDFTVNIALIREHAPAIGVVYAPARGMIYSGRPGEACEAVVSSDFDVGERKRIAVRNCPQTPTVVASRSHRSPETDSFIAALPDCETASIGSSLKFCLLASGKADLYPRFGRTMEWDTAAGDAVLRAAGGKTLTLDGRPLLYGKRNQADDADYANPSFVATGGECRFLETALVSAPRAMNMPAGSSV